MKDNDKGLKVLVVILLVVIVILGGYIVYDKTLKEVDNNVVDKDSGKKDDVVSNDNIEKKGHTLETTVGKFIIDKDGSVYYMNYENISLFGVKYALTESDLSVLGTKQKYKNYTYQNEPQCSIELGCEIEGYKLDLSNISSAYEIYFGNGGVNTTIIFLSYDGLVYDLTFEKENSSEKINITLKKCEYSDIVSVVPTLGSNASGGILIDKNGNKVIFNGNNNNNVEKKGHTLETDVGKFIIDKDGSVYYMNYENISLFGVKYALTESDLSVLGTKQKYKNYTYQNEPQCSIEVGCEIEGYKLDLSNISSAYEIYLGNGGVSTTIIFLSYDGLVYDLTFEIKGSKINITLKKDVCNCSDIVSVVPTFDYNAHSGFLIDKNGNKYNYYG